jgi:hypothetical protein
VATTAPAVALSASAIAARRPFEAWLDGPAPGPAERKAYTERLADYVDWVHSVESPAPTRLDYAWSCRDLRRLYYSRFTGGAGPLFDRILGTTDLGTPMIVRPGILADVLDTCTAPTTS